MLKTKKLSSIISISIGVSFCAITLYCILDAFSCIGLNPNFVFLIVIFFSVPILLPLISFFVNLILKNQKYQKITAEEYLYKENTYQLYLETRNCFRIALQSKVLSRKEILEIKKILNQALKDQLKYYQNYHFENDAHEIYTKLKSHHITANDMTALHDYLMPFANAASFNSIGNQPVQHYKHLRVVK